MPQPLYVFCINNFESANASWELCCQVEKYAHSHQKRHLCNSRSFDHLLLWLIYVCASRMLHKCAPTSFFPGVEVQCSEKTQKTQLLHLCRPQLACEMLTLTTEQLEKDWISMTFLEEFPRNSLFSLKREELSRNGNGESVLVENQFPLAQSLEIVSLAAYRSILLITSTSISFFQFAGRGK